MEALDHGADDYLTKPFSMEELEARIRVALRRASGQAREAVLNAGPISLDLASHEVQPVWTPGKRQAGLHLPLQ